MKKQAGFTLVEVLMAATMLTLAATLSMRAVDFIGTSQSQVKNFTSAHHIAVTVMEQLMSVYPTDAKMTAGVHFQSYDQDGNPVAAGGWFTAKWIVTIDQPITKIISIQLNVTWSDNGHSRTVNFISYRQS